MVCEVVSRIKLSVVSGDGKFDGRRLELRVFCEEVACEGMVSKGAACEGMVSKGVACEGIVCRGEVCVGMVCWAEPCEGKLFRVVACEEML